jgi:uncharacterized protein YehS (DUF1456 family)
LGLWEKSEDIDFDKLPDEYILKTTHDSGTHVICKDKKSFDYDEAHIFLTNEQKQNYYKFSENGLQGCQTQIIAEKTYEDESGAELKELQIFFCLTEKLRHYL